MKIAFIHIPKTAGFYITKYIETKVLDGYKILNSWENGLDRDWSQDELISFCNYENSYLHNHVANWPVTTFEFFKSQNWNFFSFYRHPGDRLCSLFNYLKIQMPEDTEGLSLNDFLMGRVNFPAYPAYWKKLNYFDIFNDESFSKFLKFYFDHSYRPIEKINQSENKGYDYYCENGDISKTTQKMIMNSDNYKLYKSLKKTPIINRI